jgi:hypothetical protein
MDAGHWTIFRLDIRFQVEPNYLSRMVVVLVKHVAADFSSGRGLKCYNSERSSKRINRDQSRMT